MFRWGRPIFYYFLRMHNSRHSFYTYTNLTAFSAFTDASLFPQVAKVENYKSFSKGRWTFHQLFFLRMVCLLPWMNYLNYKSFSKGRWTLHQFCFHGWFVYFFVRMSYLKVENFQLTVGCSSHQQEGVLRMDLSTSLQYLMPLKEENHKQSGKSRKNP